MISSYHQKPNVLPCCFDFEDFADFDNILLADGENGE